MKNKNNRNWYLFFSLLAYSISTFASITFVWELHISKMELTQLMATCILFMAGAWFTLKEAFAIRKISDIPLSDGTTEQNISYKHQGFSRFCYIGLYFICTIFSVFTTANMAFEAINRDSDYKTQNSDIYKTTQISKDLATTSVQTNNNTIASLLKEKEKAVNTQLAQAEGWKTSRVSERQKEINRANEIANSYDAKIANIRAENEKLQGKIISVSPTLEVSTGKKSLFDIFPTLNFSALLIIIILILGIGVDLLGAFFTIQYAKEMYFYYGQQKTSQTFVHVDEKRPTLSQKELEPVQKFKIKRPQTTFAKHENDKKIGFHFEKSNHVDENPKQLINTSFSEDEVKRYIQEMYKTKKDNGDCLGFRQIGKNIKMDTKKAEKIKGHLETLGIVKVVGNRTRIIKEA